MSCACRCGSEPQTQRSAEGAPETATNHEPRRNRGSRQRRFGRAISWRAHSHVLSGAPPPPLTLGTSRRPYAPAVACRDAFERPALAAPSVKRRGDQRDRGAGWAQWNRIRPNQGDLWSGAGGPSLPKSAAPGPACRRPRAATGIRQRPLDGQLSRLTH
jgi:hypothetical protein